jgi:hypothetical protein
VQADETGTDNGGVMVAVYGLEPDIPGTDAQSVGKGDGASATVPAEGALPPVRIEVDHAEIQVRVVPDQDKSVCTNPETAVAEMPDQGGLVARKSTVPVVNHDEIIPCAVVFRKYGFQTPFLLNIVKNTKYFVTLEIPNRFEFVILFGSGSRACFL